MKAHSNPSVELAIHRCRRSSSKQRLEKNSCQKQYRGASRAARKRLERVSHLDIYRSLSGTRCGGMGGRSSEGDLSSTSLQRPGRNQHLSLCKAGTGMVQPGKRRALMPGTLRGCDKGHRVIGQSPSRYGITNLHLFNRRLTHLLAC